MAYLLQPVRLCSHGLEGRLIRFGIHHEAFSRISHRGLARGMDKGIVEDFEVERRVAARSVL